MVLTTDRSHFFIHNIPLFGFDSEAFETCVLPCFGLSKISCPAASFVWKLAKFRLDNWFLNLIKFLSVSGEFKQKHF